MSTILVVEDNKDVRELIAKRLQRHGFAVLSASNGSEAIAVADHCNPALILMDVNLPELDGLEATTQIREQLDHYIPVIALTAYALPGDQDRALAAGCDVFHAKPIDFDKLFQQIEDLIGSLHESDDSDSP